MKKKNTATVAGWSALAIATLLLTGCSAGGQSKAEACKTAQTTLTSATDGLSSSMGDLASNPEKGVAAVDKAASEFGTKIDTITEPNVKKAASKASDDFTSFAGIIKTFAADPTSADMSKITDAATKVQDSFNALGKACK